MVVWAVTLENVDLGMERSRLSQDLSQRSVLADIEGAEISTAVLQIFEGGQGRAKCVSVEEAAELGVNKFLASGGGSALDPD